MVWKKKKNADIVIIFVGILSILLYFLLCIEFLEFYLRRQLKPVEVIFFLLLFSFTALLLSYDLQIFVVVVLFWSFCSFPTLIGLYISVHDCVFEWVFIMSLHLECFFWKQLCQGQTYSTWTIRYAEDIE